MQIESLIFRRKTNLRYGKIESILLYLTILVLTPATIISTLLWTRQRTKLEFYQKDAEKMADEFKQKEEHIKKEEMES